MYGRECVMCMVGNVSGDWYAMYQMYGMQCMKCIADNLLDL